LGIYVDGGEVTGKKYRAGGKFYSDPEEIKHRRWINLIYPDKSIFVGAATCRLPLKTVVLQGRRQVAAPTN